MSIIIGGTTGTARKRLEKVLDATEYYNHQVEGIRWGARHNSFILADDMGLGKSLQALTVAAIDFEKGWASKVLVVCPATLKGNWADECEKFTSFSHMVLNGTPRERSAQISLFMGGGWDVLIVNYEQVGPHLTDLNAIGFDIVIYDEAHYIKSYKSKRTAAAHKLRSSRSMLLTGSPLLNQVNELWSLLYKVDPGRFPGYWKFVNRYCLFGGFKDKQIVGTKNLKELQEILDQYMIRRMKKDVLDLPDKQIIPIRLDLLPQQRKVYDEAKDELEITDPSGATAFEIENSLEKYLRLKQICGTLACFPDFPDVSVKLDWAEDMAEQTIDNGEHLVVFTQFRGVHAAMCDRLRAKGIIVFELHGDVKQEDRIPYVKSWGASPPAVIVVMLQLATGMNMTTARKAVFLDELWVPKLNEQAEDRLHRIGADKTQPVQIFKLIARNTIEQRIQSLLKSKRKLFGELVDGSDWKRSLIAALKEDDDG